jgi:FkbM family methyltransferase
MAIVPNSVAWAALEFYGTRVRHKGQWRVHRWLRNTLRANFDCNLETKRSGLRWVLNPSDFVQSSFYWTGNYETWDWYHLCKLVKPHSVVFDVGANFGYYSLLLAAEKDASQVFAFEPEVETFARLQKNIALNHLEKVVKGVRIGLSDVRESAHLSIEQGNSGASFIGSAGQTIQLETLDGFCSTNSIEQIDFLKIDVEGHEMHVLTGGTEILSRCKPLILIEINPNALERSGSSAIELQMKLRQMGYVLLVPKRKKLVQFSGNVPPGHLLNVFAIQSSSVSAAFAF